MNCPHCAHEIPLTWGKYLKSRFGHHTCPGCGRRFRVVLTATSFIAMLAATVVAAGMPTVIAFFFTHNFWYTIATYFFFIVVLVIPFDRWLDNRLRPVKPEPEDPH